jgi:hypothetical protein
MINRELISNLSKLFDVSVMDMGSTAEVLISEYFDEDSRQVTLTLTGAPYFLLHSYLLKDSTLKRCINYIPKDWYDGQQSRSSPIPERCP